MRNKQRILFLEFDELTIRITPFNKKVKTGGTFSFLYYKLVRKLIKNEPYFGRESSFFSEIDPTFRTNTVCQKVLTLFYTVSYYIKWFKAS